MVWWGWALTTRYHEDSIKALRSTVTIWLQNFITTVFSVTDLIFPMLIWHLNKVSNTEELTFFFYFIVHSTVVFQHSVVMCILTAFWGPFILWRLRSGKKTFPHWKVVGELGQLKYCHWTSSWHCPFRYLSKVAL